MLLTRSLYTLVALLGSISCGLYPAEVQAANADTCIEDGGAAECIGPVDGPYRYQVQLPGWKAFQAASEGEAIDTYQAEFTKDFRACTVSLTNLSWQPLPSVAGTGSTTIGGCCFGSNGSFWQLSWRFGREITQLKIPLITDYTYGAPSCQFQLQYQAWVNRYRELLCPSEGWWDATWQPNNITPPFWAYCWRTNTQNVPKNLGDRCPAIGNPIHGGTGNKYQAEADYAGAGSMPLAFTRHYNSRLWRPSAAPNLNLGHWSYLGPNWRSSYDRFIGFAGPEGRFPTAYVYRPDGKVFYFKLINGQYVPDADIADRLVRLTDASDSTTVWQYTVSADDSVETYDAEGELVSITDHAGRTQTLSYDTQGRLLTVSDAFGRQLSFAYDTSNRIATMSDPAGGVYTYGYNSLNNVSSVTYPDGKVRTYVYNESVNTSGYSLPYALTGILDENGNRFATYKYDVFGRGVSTEHAGGADKVTLSYPTSTSTIVTDALGTARTYTSQTILGVVKNTSISQPCTGCGGSAASTTYDGNGNVATKKDFNGNRTDYSYDLTRNLETQRVEALTSTGGTAA